MTYQVPKTWKFDNSSSSPSICYIIATWSGDRRAGNNGHLEDPTGYLVKHFEKLSSITHSLNQIVLVIPDNPKESAKFKSYIAQLPSFLGQTPLAILRRNNAGQSYGSYSDAYLRYPDFDYYIFIEDDYVPVINDFDKLLAQMFDSCPEAGYLCSYAHNAAPEGAHAAISNGITSKKILSAIKDKFGVIPHAARATATHTYSADPQLEFSRAFMKVHTRIYDYLSYYSSPFNEAGKLVLYGKPNLPVLLHPIQFL